MKRLVAITALSVGAGLAYADTAYWTGGSGNFTDANHWEEQVRPTAAHVVGFRAPEEAVVNIDEDASIQYWSLITRSEELSPTTIEWIGSGSIRCTSSSTSYVYPCRRLVINGPTVKVDNNLIVTNSTLAVKSGSLTVGGLYLRGKATLDLEGGSCSKPNKLEVSPEANVNFKGGTLTWAGQMDYGNTGNEWQKLFLPKGKEAVLDLPYNSYQKAMILRKAGESSFDGTLVITNSTSSVHPGILVYNDNHTLSGNGSLIADSLCIYAKYTLTDTQKSIKLGYGLQQSNTTAAKYAFPAGMQFGAWGNWSNRPASSDTVVAVELAGDIGFDTLDCRDGKTKRTISLALVTDTGIKSLKAVGGGTVTLALPAGFVGELRRLEVGSNTTLDLTGVNSKVYVRDLVLGPNASLKLDAAKSPLEVSGAQAVDPTARIVMTAPTSMTAETLYPLFLSLTVLPEGVLVCEVEEPWKKIDCGACVFITDETLPECPYSASANVWTGEMSSSWKDAENWTSGKVPVGSESTYFARVLNSMVIYDYTGQYEGQLRNLEFHENCGPFMFVGTTLKPSYGSATSYCLVSASTFPVVISNFVACASNPGGHFINKGSSFVAMAGGGSSKGILRLRGDIRLGGTWTATNVIEIAQTQSGARATKLTVLEDGVFDLSGAVAPLTAPANVCVLGSLKLGELTGFDGLNWTGTGSIELSGAIAGSADQTLTLGDSLTLLPSSDWQTSSASAPAAVRKITVVDTPTLGASRDWTYGPANGATSSSESRALTVTAGATLTIDTEDPDNGIGHSITFADPIVGAGNVCKRGNGTLVLDTGDSRIEGEFTISSGSLSIGPSLSASGSEWIRVFVASSFAGVESALGGMYKFRIVDVDGGLKALEVQQQRGMVIIIR